MVVGIILIISVGLISCSSDSGELGYFIDQRKSKPIKWQCINEDFLNIKCKTKK